VQVLPNEESHSSHSNCANRDSDTDPSLATGREALRLRGLPPGLRSLPPGLRGYRLQPTEPRPIAFRTRRTACQILAPVLRRAKDVTTHIFQNNTFPPHRNSLSLRSKKFQPDNTSSRSRNCQARMPLRCCRSTQRLPRNTVHPRMSLLSLGSTHRVRRRN
jgi:hypothetical protein